MLPVNHVRTGGMCPVHRTPERTIGVVVVEHVIVASEKDRAIRIVHPVSRRQQVILRPQRIGRQPNLQSVAKVKSVRARFESCSSDQDASLREKSTTRSSNHDWVRLAYPTLLWHPSR